VVLFGEEEGRFSPSGTTYPSPRLFICHEVVDEMVNWFNQVDDTYRGQLRELNELNFARFDAKLEQRLAEVKAGIAELRGEFRADLHDQGKMLIRWMFGFWITTVTTLGGLVVAVLHFLPAARP